MTLFSCLGRRHLSAYAVLVCALALQAPVALAIPVPEEAPPHVGATGFQITSVNRALGFSPNVYSGTVTALQIITPPMHGVAEVRGLEMFYTPNPGYVGYDHFYYMASGPGGVSAQPGSIWLNVHAPLLTLYGLASATYGQRYAQQFDASGGSAPYRYSLVAGELPAGLVMDGATGQVSGIPAMAGSSTFSIKAVDANGFEVVSRQQLQVQQAIADIAWDVAGGLSKVFGEPDFELPLPVSEAPGEFSFSSSNPAVASVNGRTVSLAGEGRTVITAVLPASANYQRAQLQMVLNVTMRPDPLDDPRVVGGAQAQVDASVRFARVQGENIRDRLRQVRGGDNASRFNVALAYAGNNGMSGYAVPLEQAGNSMISSLPRLPEGWGLWAAGTATFGQGGRGDNSFDFNTGGLTVGADRAFSERLLLGMAMGMGRQDTEFADDVSGMDADQRSLALYGLWRVGSNAFVDANIGRGGLNFDMLRWSDLADASLRGRRDGQQWFGAVTIGYEHQQAHGLTLTGYGRYEHSRSQLDAYREHGVELYALAYREQVVTNSAFALGLEGRHLIEAGAGNWRPYWYVEYRHGLDNGGDVSVNYVLHPHAGDYRMSIKGYDDGVFAIGGGVELQFNRAWLMSLLLSHEQGGDALRGSSIGVQVRYSGASVN